MTKNKHFKTVFYTFLLIMLVQNLACTKPYSIKLDAIEKRIVVDALFCTDSLMRIRLTEDASLKENVYEGFKPIENAKVFLYEDSNIIDTAKYKGDGVYYCNFKPKTGVLYKMKAVAEGYPEVLAEDRIPELVHIDSLSKGFNDDYYGQYQIKYIFKDPISINNYYLVSVGYYSYYNGQKYWSEAYYRTTDPSVGEWFTQMDQLPVFNDDIFDGRKYEFSVQLVIGRPEMMYFRLYSISENIYLYIKSYNKQVPKFGDDIMELFQQGLVEPIPIYSNVEGGLGIFAGYTVSQDSIYIEAEYK
jgi:hypothetical protein